MGAGMRRHTVVAPKCTPERPESALSLRRFLHRSSRFQSHSWADNEYVNTAYSLLILNGEPRRNRTFNPQIKSLHGTPRTTRRNTGDFAFSALPQPHGELPLFLNIFRGLRSRSHSFPHRSPDHIRERHPDA